MGVVWVTGEPCSESRLTLARRAWITTDRRHVHEQPELASAQLDGKLAKDSKMLARSKDMMLASSQRT
ncbi:hypothetical protein FIBSPDRAFT_856607 [Athelia psychrophila]|uniref:Uncharacterized protein n=1 Tax=Athelia psychrophila TaxID=1759441 RepID=A0A166NAN9_9AGAM|nr:hypothetical protein FIBSPDRAFT_856607 [Fibularhizoctonia sp. CBS 109695]